VMKDQDLLAKRTRRDFLRDAAAAGLALAGPGGRRGEAAPAAGAYGPFKMGIQSYSLRGYGFEEALSHTRALGLHYWEAWDRHLPLTTSEEARANARWKLTEAGVTVLAFGVVSFGADREGARRLFEHAKAYRIPTLSADPAPEAFDYLDGMAREYGVNIALHNHGPRSRYDKIADVERAIRGRDRRIGACVDTGHFLRSDEDPVEAMRRFGDRLYGVHLKDVTADKRFTELGKGVLKLDEALDLLRGMRYAHGLALEYEENPRNPIPGIEESLAAVRASAAKLRKS
jgi:inosose dehydratase